MPTQLPDRQILHHRGTTRWQPLVLLAAANLACAGCRIDGTWVTIETTPQAQVFPISEITLDASGQYTAALMDGGKRRTIVGTYRLSGSALTLTSDESAPQIYRVKRRLDGTLFLAVDDEPSTSAILERLPQ